MSDADQTRQVDRLRGQLRDERCTSAAFPGARLSRRDLPAAADAAGTTVLQESTTDARAFALAGAVMS